LRPSCSCDLFPPSGDESGQNPKNALKICASLRCNLLKFAHGPHPTVCQPLGLHALPSRSTFTLDLRALTALCLHALCLHALTALGRNIDCVAPALIA